ncbi:Rap/Ran GTPase-activating protein [Entamoeba marina]
MNSDEVPTPRSNGIDLDELLVDPSIILSTTIQEEARKERKIEEINKIEEEIAAEEERRLQEQQQEVFKNITTYNSSEPAKLIKKRPTVELTQFNSIYKAIYPINDVIYFNRKLLKSQENYFNLIDATRFDILTTDPWSSVIPIIDTWSDKSHTSTMLDLTLLTDNYNAELDLDSITFTHKNHLYNHPIFDVESDFPIYNQYFHGKKNIKHYIDKESGILLSVDESKKYKKAIVRSGKELTKLVIPPDHDITRYKNIFPQPKKVFKYNNISIIDDELNRIEQRSVSKRYKFGVIYVKPHQSEDEVFGNDEIGMPFYEMMDLLADKVPLKGFGGFNGGLDTKFNNTGDTSYYTRFLGNEVMFHVAPLLPNVEDDLQKLERKRHIGNDVVVLVFLEEKVHNFDPRIFTSHFNHIFIIVQPISHEDLVKEEEVVEGIDSESTISDVPSLDGKHLFESKVSDSIVKGDRSSFNTSAIKGRYCRVSAVTKPNIAPFPPYIENGIYKADLSLRSFLLSKMINGERMAMRYPPFKITTDTTRMKQIECIANSL